MEGEILKAISHVKNIRKSKLLLQEFIQLWKKHNNLTENELENLIDNMVDKTIIEDH